MTRPALPETSAERHARERAEEEARYGALLPDVDYLRRRGDTIVKDGQQLLVNGRPFSADELTAKAARERRLNGVESSTLRRVVTTASGLRVGDKAAFAPKVVRPKAVAVPRPKAVKPSAPVLRGAAAAAKAKSEQHSAGLGARPRIVWLGLELLEVDHTYQREIGEGGQTHINRIVRAFNWNCYQPIIITERTDGRYAVIDGQHRLEAARKHPLIDSLPCYIIDAPDVAVQAHVFVQVNSARRSLTSSQKFFASLAAGEKTAVALKKICDDAQVTILRGPPGKATPPRALLGPLIAQRLVQRFGVRAVRNAMQLLSETHGQTAGAFRSATISALTRIVAGPHSRERLRAVLQATDLAHLLGQASALASGGGVGSLAAGTERVLRAGMETKAAA
jgi:hypothetical protein